MKKTIFLLVLLLLAASTALAEYDPIQGAKNDLTEVLGYTAEEAENFEFEDNGIDTVRFWPKDHPDWVYTLFYDSYGSTGGDTPFYKEKYLPYPGESAVNEMLRRAREGNWWADWNDDARAAYKQTNIDLGLSNNENMLDAIQNPYATGADALQAFLMRCYGPEYQWTPALVSLRDEILQQNGLTLTEEKKPEAGIKAWQVQEMTGATVTRTNFYQEVPEQLKEAFSQPRLAGWTCLCGALWQSDGQFKDHPRTPYGLGLAAFEKDGKRLLVILDNDRDQWTVIPVGDNALYTDCDLAIRSTYEGFSIDYTLSDTETARFQVIITNKDGGGRAYCQIMQYERVEKGGDALRIKQELWDPWTAKLYRGGKLITTCVKPQQVIPYLGAMDIREFPATMAAFEADQPELIPAGYGMTVGVHLRAKTSSRSKDLGTFLPGALIPILEELPGDPNPWYRTEVGSLKGYVSSNYVRTGNDYFLQPQAVAKAKKAVALKKGTGLLDGTVTELPEGAKMHLVLESGDWYYVCVPRGEMGCFMDPEGTYGWLKKEDVITAGMVCQLDWVDE